MGSRLRRPHLAAAAAAVLLAACTGGASSDSNPVLPFDTAGRRPTQMPAERVHRDRAKSKIQHVIIVVQENRSFNNLFYGFPGATTKKYGYNTSGQKIALQPVTLATNWDIEHDSSGFFTACNGTGSIPGTNCQMNGFDAEFYGCGQRGFRCPNANPPYSYVPHSETKPYFAMGKQYVLADQMYASNFDASSFISHQYIIA
ncbi:MAG: alkaline phosphatase family protein, partial [Candidatus Cybelea sp.]